jgi:hypothetical protein
MARTRPSGSQVAFAAFSGLFVDRDSSSLRVVVPRGEAVTADVAETTHGGCAAPARGCRHEVHGCRLPIHRSSQPWQPFRRPAIRIRRAGGDDGSALVLCVAVLDQPAETSQLEHSCFCGSSEREPGERRHRLNDRVRRPGALAIGANCEARQATGTLPCFGRATGMSPLLVVLRATLRRALHLTLASRPGH